MDGRFARFLRLYGNINMKAYDLSRSVPLLQGRGEVGERIRIYAYIESRAVPVLYRTSAWSQQQPKLPPSCYDDGRRRWCIKWEASERFFYDRSAASWCLQCLFTTEEKRTMKAAGLPAFRLNHKGVHVRIRKLTLRKARFSRRGAINNEWE